AGIRDLIVTGVQTCALPIYQIPKALFDPLAVKALGVFQASGVLTPNTGAAPGTVGYVTNNYVVTKGSNVSPINKWSIKGDHSFRSEERRVGKGWRVWAGHCA